MTNPDDESEAVAEGVRQFLENEVVRVVQQHPDAFTFLWDGRPLLSIKPDGTVIPREMFTTADEASLKFWRIVSDMGHGKLREVMFQQYLLDHHLTVFKL